MNILRSINQNQDITRKHQLNLGQVGRIESFLVAFSSLVQCNGTAFFSATNKEATHLKRFVLKELKKLGLLLASPLCQIRYGFPWVGYGMAPNVENQFSRKLKVTN